MDMEREVNEMSDSELMDAYDAIMKNEDSDDESETYSDDESETYSDDDSETYSDVNDDFLKEYLEVENLREKRSYSTTWYAKFCFRNFTSINKAFFLFTKST